MKTLDTPDIVSEKIFKSEITHDNSLSVPVNKKNPTTKRNNLVKNEES